MSNSNVGNPYRETEAPRVQQQSDPRTAYPGAGQSSGKEQVERLLDMLYRRKWSILLVFALIVGGVAAYTFTRTPLYRSNSFVMVDLGSGGPIAGELSLGQSSPSSRGYRSLQTELFVLQSSGKIYQRVSDRLTAMQDGAAEAGESAQTSTGASFPMGSVNFGPASKEVGNAITVAAVSPNPTDAARLANIYAEEYVRLTQEASRSHLSAQREFLEEQEAERLAELQAAEEAVKMYTTDETIALDQETGFLVSRIAQLEAEQDAARIDLRMREKSLEVGEQELADISPQLARRVSSGVDEEMARVASRLGELQAEKETILSNPQNRGMSADDPRLSEINNQISELEARNDELAEEWVDQVMAAGGVPGTESNLSYIAELKRRNIQDRIEIEGFRSRIELMQEQIQGYQAELNNIPELQLELARLERTRQHADQLYQHVVSQLQQARVAEESEPGYAQVIREASVPRAPFFPDPNRNMMLAVFFGLMFGLGLAVARDLFDNRIYKPDMLRKQGRSLLGVVPNIQPLVKEDFDGKEFAEIENGARISTRLVSLLSPMSAAAESYRSVRTAIQFSLPDTVIRTMLVTSSSAEEGKSTTAANLAVMMAQSGRKTVLIDADLRRPQVHRMFGLSNKPGLVQMLFAKNEKVDPDVGKTFIDNLHVITAGSISEQAQKSAAEKSRKSSDTLEQRSLISNPAELLGSRRMRDLIEQLKEQFDVVIFDTPPVLAGTDAALLSTQCDATMVVVRAASTREGELEYALESLGDVGARVIGTVFNGFDVSMAYGYKYRYGNYSKYGYYSNKYGYYSRPDGSGRAAGKRS